MNVKMADRNLTAKYGSAVHCHQPLQMDFGLTAFVSYGMKSPTC